MIEGVLLCAIVAMFTIAACALVFFAFLVSGLRQKVKALTQIIKQHQSMIQQLNENDFVLMHLPAHAIREMVRPQCRVLTDEDYRHLLNSLGSDSKPSNG